MKRCISFLLALLMALSLLPAALAADMSDLESGYGFIKTYLKDIKVSGSKASLIFNFSNPKDDRVKSFNECFAVDVWQNGAACEQSGSGKGTSKQLKAGGSIDVTLTFKIDKNISELQIELRQYNMFRRMDGIIGYYNIHRKVFETEAEHARYLQSFALRGGLTWGMSMDAAIDLLQAEDGAGQYTFTKIDTAAKGIPASIAYQVDGISFGDDSVVHLTMTGSKKHGLIDLFYTNVIGDKGSDETHAQYVRLLGQLEQTYGLFDITTDLWSKYKSVKQGKYVCLASKQINDGTVIVIWMQHASNTKGAYGVAMEYQCPNLAEYTEEIMNMPAEEEAEVTPKPVYGL